MPLPKPPTARAAQLPRSAYADVDVAAAVAARPRATPRAALLSAAAAPAAAAAPTVSANAARAAAPAARTSAPSATPSTRAVGNGQAMPQPTGARAAAVSPAPAPAAAPARGGRQRAAGALPRLFVLDTNVLMHDPTSIYRFDEHDIFLPMITLEELDGNKKGMSEVARNVRQVSRELDLLAATPGADPAGGIPLASHGHREARGKLYFQTASLPTDLPAGLPQGKADNQILGVVHALGLKHPERAVALVSKDINMRIKARAMGLATEDYFNDRTLEDGDLLYSGTLALPADFWATHGQAVESWQQGGHTYWRVAGPLVAQMLVNQFLYLDAPGEAPLHARVVEITGKTAVLRTLRDHAHAKHAVWGITARNREQNFALNLLMDPDCDFVTLAGSAGTGKTLLTLAAALSQVLDERRYSEIIVTRVTVPVGEDIGFLPGTEEEKMGPWMGALDDNLEVLARVDTGAGEWGRAATNDLVRSKVKIKSLNFMRGRTFLNRFVIIDEAQNLTPKQMKTLITRAGPGTKIVCLGNLSQIDTPYLTEGSSGLTYVVDRFKGWPHSSHLTLARGERSRLADFASDVL